MFNYPMKTINQDISASKIKLDQLIEKLDTFKIDEKKFHDIKDKVVAVGRKIDEKLIRLRDSLTGHHCFVTFANDETIEDRFGVIMTLLIVF